MPKLIIYGYTLLGTGRVRSYWEKWLRLEKVQEMDPRLATMEEF